MSPVSESDARSRLCWRCRRGMRELDLLLGAWLEQRWPGAGESERAAFERLLDFEDDRLWAWLTDRAVPEDEELRHLIADIAAHGRR